jgi:hypothetical protein
MPLNTLEDLRAGKLAGSRRLKLSCGLNEFPREIFDLADTLEILDLSGNALTSLPDDLPRLGKLRILFCSNNPFTELPAVIGQCAALEMLGFKSNRIASVPADALPPRLRWLILTDNQIGELPSELGRCARLQKLMLAGNRLQSLPPEMVNCTRLELLRISANQLSALPEWLLSLPRLSWLALPAIHLCRRRPPGQYFADSLGRFADQPSTGRGRFRRHPPGRMARCRGRAAGGAQAVQGRIDQRWLAARRNARLHDGRRASEFDPAARQAGGASR